MPRHHEYLDKKCDKIIVQILKPTILGRLNNLEVRLAESSDEIAQAIAVRASVFGHATSINNDRFDAFCDHLIVVDNELTVDSNCGKVVATYRLLTSAKAAAAGSFYSQNEFDVKTLIERHPGLKFLEFGRSCVLPNYRNKRTIELLWAGSWKYVLDNSIDVMFGCASFSGAEPKRHTQALRFLTQQASASGKWQVHANKDQATSFNFSERDQIDMKSALRELPTIIKGYLRLGAVFSTQAVIDKEFDTTDVLVIMPVDQLNPKYVKYYGADAQRYAKLR